MAFRFVHTADLHLDSPLKSLALKDERLAQLVEGATRTALANIVDLCIDEDAEALLIAGDLYDGDATSMKTAAFLAAELTRAAAAGVRTFIVQGNHDAQSGVTKRLDLPSAVHVFDGRGGVVTFDAADGTRVAVHGVSFSQRHAPESLLPKYKPPVEDALNIALMHTSLEGAAGHDPYAPVSAAALAASGHDYWALGHIHKRSVASEAPAIVMPGIPQGRHINEDGPRSATLATASDGAVALEERHVAVAEFHRVEIDAADVQEFADLRQLISDALARALAECRAAHAICRLRLVGETSAAWRFRRDADLVRETANEAAARIGGAWVEDVVIALETPTVEVGETSAGGPRTELAADIEATLADPTFQAQAAVLVQQLIGGQALPRGVRDALAADEDAVAALAARLAREGAETTLARILADD